MRECNINYLEKGWRNLESIFIRLLHLKWERCESFVLLYNSCYIGSCIVHFILGNEKLPQAWNQHRAPAVRGLPKESLPCYWAPGQQLRSSNGGLKAAGTEHSPHDSTVKAWPSTSKAVGSVREPSDKSP